MEKKRMCTNRCKKEVKHVKKKKSTRCKKMRMSTNGFKKQKRMSVGCV